MKVIFIKKKHILYIITLFFILILGIILLLKIFSKDESPVFNPIDNNKTLSLDLTGDGINDSIKVVSKDGNNDVEILSSGKTYHLGNLCENNILMPQNNSWPIKVFVQNHSRNPYPQIIVQGFDKTSKLYIFTWNKNEFIELFSSNKNIFGVIDSNKNKTPQCYSLNSSSGISSLQSFMIIDNKVLDITKDSKPIPDISNILTLIDLFQKDYELDSIPDIFKEGIPENELGLLWNLDKEHNLYSFQDGFFYDESIDNNGNITSMKWRLSFEKYTKEKGDSSKEEIIFYINTTRTPDNNYKIASLYKK